MLTALNFIRYTVLYMGNCEYSLHDSHDKFGINLNVATNNGMNDAFTVDTVIGSRKTLTEEFGAL